MEKNLHRGGQLVVRERILSSSQLKILGNQPQNLNGRLTDVLTELDAILDDRIGDARRRSGGFYRPGLTDRGLRWTGFGLGLGVALGHRWTLGLRDRHRF